MRKEEFVWIIECSLLSFDGLTEKDMIEKYNIDPELVRRGVLLCNQLKREVLRNE